MPEKPRIALSGAPGSPYTRKMLSVLRYRRLPYRFVINGGAQMTNLPRPRVQLLPTFYFPGESGELEAVTDTSPIIRRLEAEHEGRSVIPSNPGLAFLDALIEDYADEWLTKAMFHYRWSYQADIDQAGAILPCWRNYSVSDAVLAQGSHMIKSRQISRLYVVGSNAVTGPVIEASYERFIMTFDAVLRDQPFILGSRPAACDFAVYGQLTQLAAFDPTPAALTLKLAPRVVAWAGIMEDVSGLEPRDEDWIDPASNPQSLLNLLQEIGRVYAPVMLANAAAVNEGRDQFETTVDGAPWSQPPFPYQAKCLQWLRADLADLPTPTRTQIDTILGRAGLTELFA